MSHRFLYQNMIGQPSGITALTTVAGAVSGGVPRVANGTGSVVFTGDYTGLVLEVYTVEIDLAGDVGVAKFKWRKTSTAIGAWEATAVAAAATDTTLDNGVKVRFADGSASPAFSLGDRWQATATRAHSPRNVIDLDPATKHRGGSPSLDPEWLALDLLTAKAPDAAILNGHNISSGAAVKVQGGAVPQNFSLSCDGVPSVSSFVTVPDHSTIRNLFSGGGSCTGWIEPRTDGGLNQGTIFGKSGVGWEVAARDDDGTNAKLVFFKEFTDRGNVFTSDSLVLTLNQPNFITVTYDDASPANLPIITVNDAVIAFSQGTVPVGAPQTDSGKEFIIGDRKFGGGAGTLTYDGFTKELRLYNAILTPAEKTTLWNGGDVTDNLAAHWKCDEGAGTTVADSSPNSNDGTIGGQIAWSTESMSLVDETMTHQAGTMIRYLTTEPRSLRYWRIKTEGDAGNPDGRIEIAEVYLGPYFEPAFHFEWGNVLAEQAFEEPRETESKAERTILLNRGRSASLPYRHASKAEKDLFLAMFRAVKDTAAERSLPLFVHLDVDDPAALFLARLGGSFAPTEEGPDDFSFEIGIREALA